MRISLLKELFANSSPITRLVFTLFIILTSYLLISILTMLIAISAYSITFEELNLILKDGLIEADLPMLRLFQISQTIGLFIVPAILLNYFIFKSDDSFITTSGKRSISYITLIVFITLLSSMPLIQMLINWNESLEIHSSMTFLEDKLQQMEIERTQLTQRMTEGMSLADFLFNLFMIALLPAIGEEFLFRGVVQNLLHQWTRKSHLSIVIAAMIFSGIHLQFYGFIPRLILGVYFGYLFYWSRNIWLAVWAHLLNNALAISFLYLITFERNQRFRFIENLSDTGVIEIVLSILITTLLVLITYKYFIRIAKNE